MRFPDLRVRDQRIAVFGESGSGKTVLLSSFYGSHQEHAFLRNSPYRVTADDPGQGNRLNQNYLGMKNEAQLPESTRFRPETYDFTVSMASPHTADRKKRPFDALRLIWFDYPGEWFEQATAGPSEGRHKTETLQSLISSDLAVLLVDGQRLLDHAGEEEKYLKSLFHNYRTGLMSLERTLRGDGAPLERFPRIWVLGLTKTDLFDDVDVYRFRDLVVAKAAGDLDELRKQIGRLVGDTTALSVGEDFLMLSSARFEADRIEVDEQVGVDLLLPLAAVLPFERHVWWASKKLLPGQLGAVLLDRANTFANALLDRNGRLPVILTANKRLNKFALLLGLVKAEHIQTAIDLAGRKLEEANARALAAHDDLAATLTGFKLVLERAERDGTLLRSRR